MAPQSDSTAVDTIDVIDVVVPVEDDDETEPHRDVKEERMNHARRVQDEANSLRQEICQLRTRLEEVEDESKFHAAKANELTELLMNSNSIDETIIKQSEAMARKDNQIENLTKRITELETEKQLMAVERDNAKKEMTEMGKVVRSLQNVAKGSPENSYREEDDEDSESEDDDGDDDESEDSEEIVLTPETALDLTLGNLKDHIEMLEDGLQASSSLNSNQKKAINSLESDIKAQQAQIGMLEELFRELNAADRVTSLKNKKQEEEKEVSKTKKDEALDSDEKEVSPETRERALKGLSSFFGSMKAPKLTMPTREPKQPKIAIPEEAAAAAQAAAILVASKDTESIPKKSKKTKMKKVKIKFKKAGLEGTYTGPLVDKKPHGVGTIRFTNGNTYLGEMTRGKMSGTGTLYTKKGVFRGLFENNQFVGESSDENSSDSDQPLEAASSKPCDATVSTTAETIAAVDDEKQANALSALELDAFSPSNIDDAIDDSFNMMVNLDGMERKAEQAEIKKHVEREENESFLKEFSGSEHSSSLRDSLDESDSTKSYENSQAEAHEVF